VGTEGGDELEIGEREGEKERERRCMKGEWEIS
jgi:hypothetical protein